MLPTIDEENQVLFNFDGDIEENTFNFDRDIEEDTSSTTGTRNWIDGIFLVLLVASGAAVSVLLLPIRFFLGPKYTSVHNHSKFCV